MAGGIKIRKLRVEFLEKPFNRDRLLNFVNRALENSSLKKENKSLKKKTKKDTKYA